MWVIKSETMTLGLHKPESLYTLKAISWGSPRRKSLFADFQEFPLKLSTHVHSSIIYDSQEWEASKLSRPHRPTASPWQPLQKMAGKKCTGHLWGLLKTKVAGTETSFSRMSWWSCTPTKIKKHLHSRNHLAVRSLWCLMFYWAGSPDMPCPWHCSYEVREDIILILKGLRISLQDQQQMMWYSVLFHLFHLIIQQIII